MMNATTANRTGLVQRLRNHERKPMSELTIVLLHLAFIWGGGIVLWTGLTTVLSFNLMPSDEAIVLTGFILAVNVFLGWIPAMIVWVFNWGIRGWIGIGKGIKAGRAELKAQRAEVYVEDPAPQDIDTEPEEGREPLDMDEDELAAQWKAMNPYGCCMDNRDSEGYPCHGGPGCLHPKV